MSWQLVGCSGSIATNNETAYHNDISCAGPDIEYAILNGTQVVPIDLKWHEIKVDEPKFNFESIQ